MNRYDLIKKRLAAKKRRERSISGKKHINTNNEFMSLCNAKDSISTHKSEPLDEINLNNFLTYNCNFSILRDCNIFKILNYQILDNEDFLKEREKLFSRGVI